LGGVNMRKISIISIISALAVFVFLLSITGCSQTTNQPPNVTLQGAIITTGNVTTIVNQTELNSSVLTDNKTPAKSDDYKNVSRVITGTEGDLIKLDVKAYSPDGVPITYFYSTPFNNNGLWQTKDGDAGKYLVTVTATDGKLNSSVDVLVVLNPSIKAPVIDCPGDVYVK